MPKLLDGRYFTIVKSDGDKIEAVCSICKKIRKGSIKSTGNFMDHITNEHKEISNEVNLYKKSSAVIKKNAQRTMPEMVKKAFNLENVRSHNFTHFFRIFRSECS